MLKEYTYNNKYFSNSGYIGNPSPYGTVECGGSLKIGEQIYKSGELYEVINIDKDGKYRIIPVDDR